jgi:hypothetical protein
MPDAQYIGHVFAICGLGGSLPSTIDTPGLLHLPVCSDLRPADSIIDPAFALAGGRVLESRRSGTHFTHLPCRAHGT